MITPIYLNVLPTKMLGLVGVAVSPQGIKRLRMFQKNKEAFLSLNQAHGEGNYQYSEPETEKYIAQIKSYLDGELQTFNLPIDWNGYTGFQKAVLMETLAIPYGETRLMGRLRLPLAGQKLPGRWVRPRNATMYHWWSLATG